MRQLLLWLAFGLTFGFISGCIGMAIAYQDTLPTPGDHWYDLAGLFSVPGIMLTWGFFSPPDGYYGDIWDNRVHIVIFNTFSWMLISLLVFSVRSIGQALLVDIKAYRNSHAR